MIIKENLKKRNIFIFIIILIFLITQIIIIEQNNKINKEITKCHKTIIYQSSKTIFLGDSITKRYDLENYFNNQNYINKGIDGNTTKDVIERLKKDVLDYEPSRIFILIGTNDIVNDIDKKQTIENIKNIIKKIKEKSPNTNIYIESIYPINNNKDAGKNFGKIGKRNNNDIKYINKKLKEICKKENITYINVHDALTNEDGDLSTKYTNDGLHLNDNGYIIVSNILQEYL